MVLFELLQLMRVFLDYLRIEYLWHVLIMPLTNRNGITAPAFTSGTTTGACPSSGPGASSTGSRRTPSVAVEDDVGPLHRIPFLYGPRQAHELGVCPGQRCGREGTLAGSEACRTRWREIVPHLLGQHVAVVAGRRDRGEPSGGTRLTCRQLVLAALSGEDGPRPPDRLL